MSVVLLRKPDGLLLRVALRPLDASVDREEVVHHKEGEVSAAHLKRKVAVRPEPERKALVVERHACVADKLRLPVGIVVFHCLKAHCRPLRP